jgi:hypothetical protein
MQGGGLLEDKESKASKGWTLFRENDDEERAVRFRKSKLMKFLSRNRR